MLKSLKYVLLTFAILSFFRCHNEIRLNWKPEDGYISNKSSAIKIAEIVFVNVYGSEIYHKKPFTATLKDGKVWLVEGTLSKNKLGGVPYIAIQKSDGKILRVTHGQ